MTRRVMLVLCFVASYAAFGYAAKTWSVEIYPDAKDEWRWRMKDAEGTTVATSGQGYKAKADCKTMVENFKADISKYTFEVYEDNKKETRFRIKAKNGNTVGSSSSSYKTKAEADKAVEALQKNIKDATVSEAKKE